MTSTEQPPDEPERHPNDADDPDAEAADRVDELEELQRQFDVAHDSPPPPARGEV